MEGLVRRDQLKALRLKPCPPDPLVDCLAREQRIGGDDYPVSLCLRPIDQLSRTGALFRDCAEQVESVIVEVLDGPMQLGLRHAQPRVEIAVEDCLESEGWV